MQDNLGSLNGLILFGALIVSLLILLNASYIAEVLSIEDIPDNHRKRHARITPLVGGIAVIIPLMLWSLAMWQWGHPADPDLVLAILFCGAGVTLVGYADDQSKTSPSSRLLSLFLFSGIAFVLDPQLLPHNLVFGNLGSLPLEPWAAYCFLAIAMAGFVNGVNMADGQNGIVPGMYAIWAGCLMVVADGATQSAAQILFETTFLVLIFNLSGRTFLGDSGTYGISFVIGLLAIRAHNHWGVTGETILVWFFIPVMDCLRLMFSRALKGRSPSDGDRNHLHHRLSDRLGRTPGLIIYLGMVGSTSLVAALRPDLALVCVVLLSAFYFSFAWLAELEEKDGIKVNESDGESMEPGSLQIRDNVVVLETKDVSAAQK